MQLRAEIFPPELLDSIEEDQSDEEYDGYDGYYNNKVSSANKKRMYERNHIAHNIQNRNNVEEERKIMRNYLDEETLEEEYKKATKQFFGKKEESPNKNIYKKG